MQIEMSRDLGWTIETIVFDSLKAALAFWEMNECELFVNGEKMIVEDWMIFRCFGYFHFKEQIYS